MSEKRYADWLSIQNLVLVMHVFWSEAAEKKSRKLATKLRREVNNDDDDDDEGILIHWLYILNHVLIKHSFYSWSDAADKKIHNAPSRRGREWRRRWW